MTTQEGLPALATESPYPERNAPSDWFLWLRVFADESGKIPPDKFAPIARAIANVVREREAESSARLEAAERQVKELQKALSASAGYLMNAKIDLETGAKKATAINTIEGGLRVVSAALEAKSHDD